MTDADADAAPDIPPGFEVVGEQYRLIEKLGEGAFGEVYRAHHTLLDEEFAVKILRPELCEDADVRDRFLDEARALIRFSHTNVVQLRHVGEQGTRLFLVMDLVRGLPLDEVIRADGPFSEERAIAVMKQVLAGLEAAHAAGIIHRDLKPSNLVIEKRPDGTELVRLLDFGLSKLHSVDGMKSAHRSMTGTIIGTLAYMSPEQLKGSRDIDGRSDVFAAGLLLQEMLQGEHPYPGESGIVVAAKLLRDPLPDLDATKAPSVSTSTRSALSNAVARDRDARFPSATTFAQALEGKGPPSDTSRVTTVQDAQRELAKRERAARKKEGAGKGKPGAKQPATSSSRSWLPVLVLLLLGAGAAGAWAAGVFDSGDEDDPTEVSRTDTPDPEPVKPDPEPVKPDPEPVKPDPEPVKPDPEPVKPDPEPVKPDPEPVKPDPEPVKPDPEPVKPDPEPVKPDPEPVKPDPEPVKPDPEPVKPDPEPVKPDPEPVKPDPEPVKPDPEPVKPDPEPVKPDPEPIDPTASLSPKDCCSQAATAMAAGDWAKARKLYTQALHDPKASRAHHVAALRGVAEAWFGQVDEQARSGRVDDALKSLQSTRAFLDERIKAYGHEAKDATRFQTESGFARMHLGEAHTKLARWLNIAKRVDEARAHLKPAADSFEFAHPMLDRDGANYAEFLIRRGALHRLKGDLEAYFEDLKRTTITNNTEVPPHAWVAHATGARHIAEVWWARNEIDKGKYWANLSVEAAKSGVSWYRDKFSQEEWVAMTRTLFVAGALIQDGDPLPLFGLANFWTGQARKAKSGLREARLQQAQILECEAVTGYLAGRSDAKRNQADKAGKKLAAALAKADEALKLRQAVAADGGALPIKYTQQIRAALLMALGRSQEAQAAAQAAAQAEAQNPD